MSQITSGLRSVLSSPAIYNAFQRILGTRQSKARLIREFIRINPNQSLLDIGCGTGLLLEQLPESINYVGIDQSFDYIRDARARHGNRGTFIQQRIDEINPDHLERFDRVVALGLLHHLDDHEVVPVLALASKLLHPDTGEFHSIDPCYADGQSVVSRYLVSHDRGQNVRRPEEYASLARQVFQTVTASHRTDMLRLPYDHTILRCR